MRHEIRTVFSLSGSLSCVSATVGAIPEKAASLAKVNFNPCFAALHHQGSAGLTFVCPDFRVVAVRLSLTLSLSLFGWVGGCGGAAVGSLIPRFSHVPRNIKLTRESILAP